MIFSFQVFSPGMEAPIVVDRFRLLTGFNCLMKAKVIVSSLAYVFWGWGVLIFLLYKCLKTGLNCSKGQAIIIHVSPFLKPDRR